MVRSGNLPILSSCASRSILYNHAYRLLAVAPDLHEGLMEITAEFETNWNDFVERDESGLTGGALQFRKRLLALFYGES